MPNIIRYLAVLIALVALPPHSYPQTTGKLLEGITSVDIVVEELHDGARSCGVTKSAVRAAAAFPIATSRLHISETSVVNFYIQTFVLSEDIGCSAAFKIEVYLHQDVMVLESNLRKYVTVELWERSALTVGPTNTFAEQLSTAIESLAKQFVVDWTLDQQ